MSLDREKAHCLLDEFIDLYDASPGVNDPEKYASAREAAFAAYSALMKLLGRDLMAERFAAARISRRPFEPSSAWGSEAIEAARYPVQSLSEMDTEGACGQRRMLARLVLDHEDELPAGFAMNFAVSMFLLNLGEQTPLTKPYSIQNLQGGAGRKKVASFAIACHVYYLKGYRERTIDEVILAEAEVIGSLSRDALNKIVERLGISKTVKIAQKQGVDDRLAGRKESSPYTVVHDLTELAALRRGGAPLRSPRK